MTQDDTQRTGERTGVVGRGSGAGVGQDDTQRTGERTGVVGRGSGAGVGQDERGLTRRAALALIGGGTAAVLVGGTVALKARDDGDGSAADTAAPPPDPLPDSDARLEGIAQVGARYRELVPDEATEEALLAAIPMSADLPDTPEALEEEIGARRDQIREDFTSGEVVDVDGWQLSRTEARLAALISLES